MESSAAPADQPLDASWSDPKRYLWLLGLIVPLLPLAAWAMAEISGLGICYWLGPLVVFGLRHFDGLPELPSGYATMIVTAYVPPLWRRVMDRRVLDHYGGDVSRANILPRRREKILARYRVSGSTAPPTRAPSRPSGAPAVGAQADLVADARAHRCPGCGFTYETATGAPREGFPAGTAFARIPEGWRCPDCGVREKRDFEPLGVSSA